MTIFVIYNRIMEIEIKKTTTTVKIPRPESIKAFAQFVGVSRQAVYSWINGNYIPTAKHLKRIRDYHG
jgi:transcriptional regulator with XRE-family HTH domain